MYAYSLKNENRERSIYIIAISLSILIHLLFLILFKFDFLIVDLSNETEELPEEVTVVFPENKPKQIVENINENEEVPEKSDLLSDRNSRAANPDLSDLTGNQPYSAGNIPLANLTDPNQSLMRTQLLPSKKFSKDALRKDNNAERDENFFRPEEDNITRAVNQAARNQQTTNNIYDQKQFSADQLGNLTLSTYSWEWAPYINSLKRKLHQVWFAPVAYYRLGLIHGYTDIRFSISRDGRLLEYSVLDHKGHESLRQSSVNAITSVFPFKPLPENFPEDNLTITARLIYPNLREGSY